MAVSTNQRGGTVRMRFRYRPPNLNIILFKWPTARSIILDMIPINRVARCYCYRPDARRRLGIDALTTPYGVPAVICGVASAAEVVEGFHVIGRTYRNPWTVVGICLDRPSPHLLRCYKACADIVGVIDIVLRGATNPDSINIKNAGIVIAINGDFATWVAGCLLGIIRRFAPSSYRVCAGVKYRIGYITWSNTAFSDSCRYDMNIVSGIYSSMNPR